MSAVDTFQFLLGAWSIERTIADYASGVHGSFQGAAQVQVLRGDPAPPWLRQALYEEEGRMRFGAFEGTARRSLTYIRQDDTTVAFRFCDGRPFIRCDLRRGHWRADHPCGEDRYELSFSVLSPDALDEYWRVRGPSTDYEAWTTLLRLPESPDSPSPTRS